MAHMYGMGKIHPTTVSSTKLELGVTKCSSSSSSSSVWTVWKKSSMTFQGTDGFSVYDGEGRLAFRVDNYSRKHSRSELILMDGAGRALLTLRPQVLSMHDQWNAFTSGGGDGDDDDDILRSTGGPKSKIFSMRRRRSFLRSSDEVEVFVKGSSTCRSAPDFRVEGRFRQRSCTIRSSSGDVVAQISRKAASKTVVLGDDVFSLRVVDPGAVDCSLIMALIVVMDRICPKPYAPMFMCS